MPLKRERRAKKRPPHKSVPDHIDAGESLQLRNPHSILTALKVRPTDVDELRVSRNAAQSRVWSDIIGLAESHGIDIVQREFSLQTSDVRLSAGELHIKPRISISISKMFSDPKEGDIWIGVDGVQDARNIGAIARSAQFFGARGMIITRDRTSPITSISHDVAAGGLEALPLSQPPNLAKALETIKSMNVWVVGTAEEAESNLNTLNADRPWLVLLGNEEKGLRRLTREACDVLTRIENHSDTVTSLNVSVAAGVALSTLRSRA